MEIRRRSVTPPSVSVVVSTYTTERYEHIVRCLDSLERQTTPPTEVVLVLDPDPGLVSFFRDRLGKRARILTPPQGGLSAARNEGIRCTQGDIVAFIDDDAHADEEWLENLVAPFTDPGVMAVGGRIDPAWTAGRPPWFPADLDWIVGCTYDGHPECAGEVRNAIGANMAIRRSATAVIPEGFRTDIGRVGKQLLGSEEMEWCVKLRLRMPEARIVYQPTARVHHVVPPSRAKLGYVFRRAFGEGRSKRYIKSAGDTSKQPLESEGSYLRYIVRRSIPSKLRRPSFATILQILTIGLVVLAAAAGYLTRPYSRS